ncbi:MAG: hypothetical protein ABI843_18065 [Dokdonella sp.]
MNIKPYLLAALSIVTAGGFATAHAVPTAHQCNACTEVQYENEAKSYALSSNPTPVYVYDFTNNNLRKYRVWREPIIGGYDYWANRVAVSAAETNSFGQTRQAWVDTAHSMRGAMTIDPIYPPGSGYPGFPSQVSQFIVNDPSGFYGIGRNSSLQNSLYDFTDQWMTHYVGVHPSNSFDALWGALNSIAALLWEGQNPLQMTVTINVPGGGRITLKLASGDNGPRWTLAGMRDRNNNDVPLSQSQLIPSDGSVNAYSFGTYPNDSNNFFWYVTNLLNVPVVQGQHGGWIVGCSRIPDGTTRCIWVF